ncbi:DegV family protein [Aciduricibacillus chroicocephali]|uniref:DegV family protein n=1 Tax=Aciduricibacillus chroicocephali TaxID=3054939 RepID=A0ABY9KWK4_9BACI|nr:DegV family protein [Bacillaceae bacterium 44XB]
MKTAVLTDSTAYIPDNLLEQYNIYTVPLSVNFESETYREGLDLSTEAFYEKMRSTPELPKTSQPPIGLIVETLEEISKEHDACICIHLSSGISGTYQSVLSAGTMVEELEVFGFDSEISCMAQGFYVLEAAKMAQDGETPDVICARLAEMKKTLRAYFMVDDLKNLQKGGRLSSAQALIGSMLQVKPILHVENKVIVPFAKIRTRKKAIATIMGMLEEDAATGKLAKVTFIHANALEMVKELQMAFSEKFPEVETILSTFGPVIGTHLGEGALGIGWYLNE